MIEPDGIIIDAKTGVTGRGATAPAMWNANLTTGRPETA